jgi:hypothetical protein
VTAGSLADLEQENLQIASVVVDAEQKENVGARQAEGELKHFWELEKQIACGIVEDLGRDCDTMPEAFGKIHTKSMPAMLAYSEGLDYMDEQRYDEARVMFQQALDEDPDFDLAEIALMAAPYSVMIGLATTDMVSSASSGGVPSATAGTAVAGSAVTGTAAGTAAAGGIGLGTTAAVVGGVAVVGGGVALVAAGGSSGGGGGKTTPPSVANITGDWRGTWNDAGGTSGEISLSLEQSKASVSGSALLTGSECISNGTVSGNVSGNNVTLTIDAGTEQATFTATFNQNALTGELKYTEGACKGDTANVETTLTGGADVSW